MMRHGGETGTQSPAVSSLRGVTHIDEQGTILWADRGYELLVGGVGREQLFAGLGVPSHEALIEELVACCKSGACYRHEIIARSASHEMVCLTIEAQPTNVPGLGSCILVVLTDNTRSVIDRSRAERTAREYASLWSALDAHSLVSVTDERGRIIDVNPGFCAMTGYSRQELLGKDHRDRKSVV